MVDIQYTVVFTHLYPYIYTLYLCTVHVGHVYNVRFLWFQLAQMSFDGL